MRKTGYVLLWIGATSLLALATWTAVGLAGEQVSDDAIAPLSASQIANLPVATSSTTVPLSPTTTIESLASTTTSTTVAPGQTIPPTSTPATTTPTPPVSTTSTTSPSTTTTVTTSEPAVTSVHSTEGGTVAIEVTGEVVRLLWATPASGFLYEVEDAGPERVEVEFKSSEHESQLRAEVIDGELRVEIEEEPEGD